MNDLNITAKTLVNNNVDELPEDISCLADRLRQANLYFDDNPPRAHSEEELDAFFKRI